MADSEGPLFLVGLWVVSVVVGRVVDPFHSWEVVKEDDPWELCWVASALLVLME